MHMFNILGSGGLMIVFSGALAVIAIRLGQTLLGQREQPQQSTAEENIRLRYSRGEISRDEYLWMLEDLAPDSFNFIEPEYQEKPKRRLHYDE